MPNLARDDLLCVLTEALQKNHVSLSPAAIQKLMIYLQLLKTWNCTFNLTAITDTQQMVYLHIIDSLLVAPYVQGERALDVGSGAGLPGLPLAILEPEIKWTLLDKNSKKTRFLTHVIAELGLKNVEVVHSRCEDFQPRKSFDSILSRAFGTIKLFLEVTEHLSTNGVFIALKGKYPKEELRVVPSDFVVQHVTRLTINGIDVERHVVSIKRKEQWER